MSSSLNNADQASIPDDAPATLRLQDIVDGGFAELDILLAGEAASLIVYRDGCSARAWRNVCPHTGRRLDWSPGKFLKSKDGLLVCAVHGASFEMEQGVCVAGPCRGDRLDAVVVVVDEGRVVLAEKS